MKKKERPKRDFLPTNCAPLPLHLWPNLFFLAHLGHSVSHHSPALVFFHCKKQPPWILYTRYTLILLWSHGNSSSIAPLSFLSLSPPPHILLCPSHLSQSMTCLCPFSILFPDPFACHLTSFRLLPYRYFRRIFLFVLSDTRTSRTVYFLISPLFYSYLIERGLADRIIQ